MLADDCGADALCLPPPGQALGKPGRALLWKKSLYTHKLHKKQLIATEMMTTRETQGLHCGLVALLKSSS